jgi:hypothetical protein
MNEFIIRINGATTFITKLEQNKANPKRFLITPLSGIRRHGPGWSRAAIASFSWRNVKRFLLFLATS